MRFVPLKMASLPSSKLRETSSLTCAVVKISKDYELSIDKSGCHSFLRGNIDLIRTSFGFSSLPECENCVATLLIYGPHVECGLSGKVLIILENVELLHIYDVFLLGHRKRLSYIEKICNFSSQKKLCYKHLHIYIYNYVIYIYKIGLLFIFIVTLLKSIRSTLGSRQIFLVWTVIMTSLEVTLSFEIHIKLICIPSFMSNKKSNAFPSISVNSQE